MSLYDDTINTILKQLDKKLTESYRNLETNLSKRSLLGSNATKPLYQERQELISNQIGDIIPNLMLQGARENQQQENWLKNYLLGEEGQKFNQQLSMNQLGENQRQFDVNKGFKQRELDLTEEMQKSQMEAQKYQQDNWWQPLLGQAIGSIGGGFLSDLLPIDPFGTKRKYYKDIIG